MDRRPLRRSARPWLAILAGVLLATAGCTGDDLWNTDFVSADEGQAVAFEGPVPELDDAALTSNDSGAGERSVEEGDIYRVLADGYILNLNAYRGLQVIDVGDVADPEIVGRVRISGTPVEMYVAGDRAFVLLNDWRGYYGSRYEEALETRHGGLVLSVDLRDRERPVVVDRAHVPGSIRTSRLTRGGSQAALYVVTGGWSQWETGSGDWVWETRTVVKSFDVSSGRLLERSQLDLGGYVSDVQATTDSLLVARYDWTTGDGRSQVSIIDIRDPAGAMLEGDQVTVAGFVETQFNMDHDGDVVRIVSGSRWNGSNTNHVETFDARDLRELKPIDHATFGDGEQLFATLFLGNKAFFVTYLRVDPFHAFEIADDGTITEKAEFIVSGWNDFFRPVQGETRLIGIGTNDEAGRTLSVSLYDITELENPEPLLARADVAADHSWSEASWDHRAFSVLEDAVAVRGAGGARETGLVLLPFSGWDDASRRYTAGVQIYTFSSESLTRRGAMEHGTPVRRSFQPERDLTANLSEAELSLFDSSDPDAPKEQGRIELAPSYTDVFVFGDHRARVKNGRERYWLWWGERSELLSASVEIVPRSEDPDSGEPVARFEVPAHAQLHQTGDLLVAHARTTGASGTEAYESVLTVYDLSDPTHPRPAGRLETDRLRPSYGYGPIPLGCFDCGRLSIWPGDAWDEVEAVPGGLVFLQRRHEQASDGVYRYWQSFELEVLDLTDPDAPRLAETIELGREKHGVGLLTDGSDVWVSHREPAEVEGDARPHVRHYVTRIDLAVPGEPRADTPINVPGQLLAVEGATIYTRDAVWGERFIETSIARVLLADGRAYPLARRAFPEQLVENVALDGAGHVVVSHRLAWQLAHERGVTPNVQSMTLLDAAKLTVESAVEVDDWALLRDARAGRALFQVPGGLLVFNLDDASRPYPQAYFPTLGWPRDILVDDREILFAAGRYGIHVFDLDAFNLQPCPEGACS